MVSELPAGWAIVEIGRINAYKSETIDPSKYPQETFELYSVPTFPTRRPETIGGREIGSTKQKVRPDDVLLCKINPRINRVWVVGKKAEYEQIASSEWIVLRQAHLDSSFIRYQLRESDFRERLCAEVSGVGGSLTRAQPKKVEGYTLRIAPLAEQKRIAQKLDALLAQVDTLKARIDAISTLLKRLRHATLSAAANGDLTQDWREGTEVSQGRESANQYLSRILEARRLSPRTKFKPPVAPDTDTRNTEVPATWVVSSVSSFAECLDSMRVPVKKELRAREGGTYPYFGANGEVDRVDQFIFDDDLVLVTEDETFYGRVKPIAYKYSGKCWVNNHVHALRAHDKVGQSFLCYILMHYDVIPWLTGTTGRAKLTQGALLALPIGVPPPDEQAEIVRRVDQLFAYADQLETKVSTAQKRIDTLTQSLLAKAFRGELVPQDPNDEPASVLLERIRAQRAAEPKPKRGRKTAAN